MMPQPPPGQGPIDPRGSFSPPPAPGGFTPPPPIMYPAPMPPPFYPAPQRATSFARAIFMTLATSVFGLSLAMNAYLLLVAGIASGRAGGINQEQIVSGDHAQKIAVIPVSGVIDDQSVLRFERLIRQAQDDASVKGLVIEVDTPGGGVTASDQIYRLILDFKQKKSAPVVVAMGGMATSGGYYISCAADEIYAQPTTITGNIGVVLFRMNLAEMLDKLGVKETSITPDGSKFKNSESWFKPETPETAQYLRGLANDTFERFKQIVQTSRGSKLTASIDEAASGKAFTANEALRMKLIDQLGYTSDAYLRAAALAGLKTPTVVRYRPQESLLATLMGASFGSAKSTGIDIHMDSTMLHDASRPRLMYLWQGQ